MHRASFICLTTSTGQSRPCIITHTHYPMTYQILYNEIKAAKKALSGLIIALVQIMRLLVMIAAGDHRHGVAFNLVHKAVLMVDAP